MAAAAPTTGKWEWMDDGGVWQPYHQVDNLLIEKAYQKGQEFKTKDLSFNAEYGSLYVFDFRNSTQTNTESGRVRRLRRREGAMVKASGILAASVASILAASVAAASQPPGVKPAKQPEKAPPHDVLQQRAPPPPAANHSKSPAPAAAPVVPTKLQVIIKTVVGESHEIEVSSLSKEKTFEVLQLAIERELGVPPFRQRLLLDGGRASLRTGPQLHRMLESLPVGAKLSIQLVTKRDFFQQCSQHQEYEGKILCVPCGKVLCHKCLFSHINGAQDSQTTCWLIWKTVVNLVLR
jgi:hypothetical protein